MHDASPTLPMLIDCLASMANYFFALYPHTKPSAKAFIPIKLIAHRGAHQHPKLIENTLPAFREALKAGCWGIELDIHATADKILVVHHDPDLKRLWGIKKKLADLNFSDLKKLVPDIPTLDEVIAEFGKKIHLFIELKAPFRLENALQIVLKPLQPEIDYHLISLDGETLKNLQSFPKACRLPVAMLHNLNAFCRLSLQEQFGGVLGHYALFSKKRLQTLKATGQKIGVGFVDSKYSLYREVGREIPWLFTNEALSQAHLLAKLQAESSR